MLQLYLPHRDAPLLCPLPGCGFSGPDYLSLLSHYGGVPHRKVNMLLINSGSNTSTEPRFFLAEVFPGTTRLDLILCIPVLSVSVIGCIL
jgi:hypothetical protein